MSQFNPITVYDAPSIMLGQFIDGEVTARGLRNTFVAPSRLSPSERQTLGERVMASTGGSPLAKAAADIALNPLTWLMFVTSPAGASAVRRGTGLFTNYAASVVKDSAFLRPFLNILDAIPGAHLDVHLTEVTKKRAEWYNTVGSQTRSPLSIELERRFGHSDTRILTGQAKVDATIAEKYYWAALSGLHKGGDEVRATIEAVKDPSGQLVGRRVVHSNVTHKPWDFDVDPEVWLRQNGYGAALDDGREVFRKTLDTLLTADNVPKIYRTIRQQIQMHGYADFDSVVGSGLVGHLMGPVLDEVAKGTLTEAQFVNLVEQAVVKPAQANMKAGIYFPRNTFEDWVGGKEFLVGRDAGSRAQAAQFGVGGFAIPRDAAEPIYHPDDLAFIQQYLGAKGDGFKEALQKSQAVWTRSKSGTSSPVTFLRINGAESMRRYEEAGARTWAAISPPTPDMLRANAESIHRGTETGFAGTSRISGDFGGMTKAQLKLARSQGVIPTATPVQNLDPALAPRGGYTMMDMLWAEYAHVKDGWASQVLGRVAIPNALGIGSARDAGIASSVLMNKRLAHSVANGGVGRMMEKAGLGSWVESLRQYGDEVTPSIAAAKARMFDSNVSHWLYATHLGVSMGAVVMNMMQPWVLGASTYGVMPILRGYQKAFEQLGSYAADRIKYPLIMEEADRLALIRKHFRLANVNGEDLIGITGSLQDQLDASIFATSREGLHRHARNRWQQTVDLMMKPFEKVEWMNKLVIGHAAEDVSMRAGLDAFTTRREIRLGSGYLNFTNNGLFAPIAYQLGRTTKDLAWTGDRLADPNLRMFATYPIRTALQTFRNSGRLAGGVRDNLLPGAINDIARAAAISTIIYEGTKGLFGTDISRGLFVSSATDILPFVSSGRFDDQDKFLPLSLPPAIDIPVDFISAVATDDADLMANSIMRLVPGGLALNKALGASPKLPDPIDAIQNTYADWNARTPEGMIPVYKRDGTLVNLRSPTELTMRAFGVDLGRFQQAGALDKFLTDNRDEMAAYRRDFINAQFNGNHRKATQLQAEFQKRFKIPLLVSQQQLKQAADLRSVGRSERILDRLPPDARPLYSQMVGASNVGTQNVDPSDLQGVATSAGRRGRSDTVGISPAKLKEIEQRIRDTGPATSQESGNGFTSFTPFSP